MYLSRLVLAVAALVVLPGYRFDPISRVFAPSGSSATQAFEVSNDGPDRIALVVSVLTLERDEDYVESNRDAEDDFLVYPSQLVLSPGKRQTVRVTWLGEPKPVRELTYRIVVEQVPITRLDPRAEPVTEGRVQVLLNYRGTLFVRPPGAAPDITVEARSDDAGGLVLTLVNRGTAVGLVKHCDVTLTSAGGQAIALPASALAVIHNHRVLAGGRRRYKMAWPAGLAVAPMKASGRCVVEP